MKLVVLALFTSAIGLSLAAHADDWLFYPPPLGQAIDQQLPGPKCLAPKATFIDARPRPCDRSDYETWLRNMVRERAEHRTRIGHDSAQYEVPGLRWTQSSFIQALMMVHDRYFFDPVQGRYTVNRYADDLQRRYGGIDAVLIWPTYPNLGIDDRNQADMIRSMPNGIEGVRQMVSDFHRRNIRVFFPMMLWDQGTRDIGEQWPRAVAQLMKAIGADGVNGDTQSGIPRKFVTAAESAGHLLAFQPEMTPPDEAASYNLLTWGSYQYSFVPSVNRFKWIEPRHMVNVADRWSRDKTDNLQFAFFNGVGWESWENVWGIWNGITARDAEATRRIATLERQLAPFLTSQGWEPFFPTLRVGVFASRWPMADATVWTVINRNEFDLSGPQIELPIEPGLRYFDLYHGIELKPERDSAVVTLSFDLESKGIGAVLASKNGPPESIVHLMAHMRSMTVTPLSNYSSQWVPMPQQMAPTGATPWVAAAPSDMVDIPEGNFMFKVDGTEIAGLDKVGVDVQYPWESSPRGYHEHVVHIKRFWIDKYPVTNVQFKQFLETAHYRPKDSINFLRDWKDGTFPEGWGNRPVTWVSREDAEAYASWAGKRLPHEWEWQFAAQGTDSRTYPWGRDWDASAVPVPDRSRSMRGPDAVTAHPKGASPFGVMDLVGNVWQWTDEFFDDHTRAAILRGGSYYQAQGSLWYFPQAYKLTEHGKFLLMSPGMDRSGAIGFRCAKDAARG